MSRHSDKLVVLPKEFAFVQDKRKRKRTKEMMDKLKELVGWHKSNSEQDVEDDEYNDDNDEDCGEGEGE